MWKEALVRIVDKVDGALGVTLIGVDGLPIAEYAKTNTINMGTLGAELTLVYKNAVKLVEELRYGSLQEISLVADKSAIICRSVTDEYYLLMAVTPQALMGKGRYQLRQAVADFREQLQ